ncbi:hypothetical protein MHPYR_350026 [uncultured Mycobacterium sp.]|uniref:Uncharacterized protein n=1 Tax=uncultured Mycobacterium sp. TaxID=171292 RepID=A0A1Y5PD90_9MYCO|nr:hypothetical protein MHPYR_350026 [uncultured Mycobacterium sp.]
MTTGAGCPTASAWRSPTGWACRSCGLWSPRSSTARSECTTFPAAGPMSCYVCHLGDVRAREFRNSKCDGHDIQKQKSRPLAFAGAAILRTVKGS